MAADVNDLIKSITADVKLIVRNEVELAKSELIPSGKNAGIGAGMFGGAGYTGLNAASLLFMAGGFGIGCLFQVLLEWPILGAAAIGFVIMAVLLLIITAILAMIGKGRFEKVKGPQKAQLQAEATVNEAKAALERGNENVKSGRSFEEYLVEQERRKTDIVPIQTNGATGAPLGSRADVAATRGDAPTAPQTGATAARPGANPPVGARYAADDDRR